MANAFHYSIGRKFIQAVSGAFLVVFLLLHGTINFFSVIDSFTGGWDAYDGLFQLGCDFMALPIVTIMVPVLALGIIVHIIYGCYLTWYNVKARGGYKRYEVASKAKADSWSAKNMFVLGIIILGILFFHLTHFWAKMQLLEFCGSEAENPYMLLEQTFGSIWVLRSMVPPLPWLLEHVPDRGLGQPGLDEETQGIRHHRGYNHLGDVHHSSSQRIPPRQRYSGSVIRGNKILQAVSVSCPPVFFFRKFAIFTRNAVTA